MDPFTLAAIAFVVWALYKSNPSEDQASAAFTFDDGAGYGGVPDMKNPDTSAGMATTRLAQAIAFAEGFYVPGSRPARDHNPGDMTADLIGRSVGKDGAYVVYSNDADGWANLYAQINAWLTGRSRYHSAASTILDLAGLGHETGYTATEQQFWANNVAGHLGVSPDTQIGSLG